jgi:glycosyltransferase involved in cell wall biosynthesis
MADVAEGMGIGAKVKFPGSIPRAAEFLPAIDIGCLTSHTEGMSNFIMEASGAGIPMISTRCGDSAELIEDGVTGYIVPTENEASMANNLGFLLASPELRCRMGKAARRKMQCEFSIKSMIAGMTDMYEDALAAKGFV